MVSVGSCMLCSCFKVVKIQVQAFWNVISWYDLRNVNPKKLKWVNNRSNQCVVSVSLHSCCSITTELINLSFLWLVFQDKPLHTKSSLFLLHCSIRSTMGNNLKRSLVVVSQTVMLQDPQTLQIIRLWLKTQWLTETRCLYMWEGVKSFQSLLVYDMFH